MDKNIIELLPKFLEVLGIEEQPMGTFYSNKKPSDGYSPNSLDLPTIEKEINNEVDWAGVFSGFTCAMQKIWIARKKNTTAYFSAKQFGCVGGAYYFGFVNPLPNTIIQYISTGIPNVMEGELYHKSPDDARNMLEQIDPVPASGKYCIFKPLQSFKSEENPVLITFFVKPETLSGLHRLVTYVTKDPEAVISPWSAACGSLVLKPLFYLSKGLNKAVIGGMDPTARKYLKTDELTFTVPIDMFTKLIYSFDKSFLKTDTWATVQKKIALSKKAWGEI
jgi:uncharacterized protein (DUF169 family)